ncbi:hypothetical protein BGW80DRAFT_372533 [Lactifluus volemus]|nr:hypothetical protein BGW80DRAFT_372533 [Lactifluus volemus]
MTSSNTGKINFVRYKARSLCKELDTLGSSTFQPKKRQRLLSLSRVHEAISYLWNACLDRCRAPPFPQDMSPAAWPHLLFGGTNCHSCSAPQIIKMLLSTPSSIQVLLDISSPLLTGCAKGPHRYVTCARKDLSTHQRPYALNTGGVKVSMRSAPNYMYIITLPLILMMFSMTQRRPSLNSWKEPSTFPYAWHRKRRLARQSAGIASGKNV